MEETGYNEHEEGVTADELMVAERQMRFSRQLSKPEVFPSVENWQYVTEHAMSALCPLLYGKYLAAWLTEADQRCDLHQAAMASFAEYAKAIDRETALASVYADVTTCPEATLAAIRDARLFDARRLLELLADPEVHHMWVVDCLTAYQPRYTDDDLTWMQAMSHALDTLPPMGEVREVRGIFGRDIRYICPEGHANSVEQEYCTTCGLNINGLDEEHVAIVDDFRQRVATLSKLLKNRPQ